MNKLKLNNVTNISFNQKENQLSSSEKETIENWWKDYSNDKTYLFNGEILAIQSVKNNKGKTEINWYKSKYAHYLIEDKNIENAKILYCSVLVFTDEEKLLVVKTSNKTASKGKLMLPGGNIELENNKLNIEICKKNAIRELEEEIGIKLTIKDISLWQIKEGGKGGEIGLFFKSKKTFKEVEIKNIFKQNQDDEIAEIYFVKDIEELKKIENVEFVDYIEKVVEVVM